MESKTTSRFSFGSILQAATARRDLVVVVLLVTSITSMVLPITPTISDALIAVNIGISVLLLMVAFYVHSPAEFSSLPSVILIMTVFRLSISIAATRLILLEADGGQIIQTFGDFVIGGNVVVGLVVFVIITIVQFVVITKGSERVAEVAARFSLDGLPGKQMSIDSDLRNGDLDQAEARRRRQNLERESQLYGAMDGAMKFVKGDAIAGIIIIAVNLFGGMAVGIVQRGLSFGDATHLFSLLTIGEGLIAQIPALFISLTAGTIVTRITTNTGQNLGAEIVTQIVSKPEAMRLASGVLLGLAFVPGFPAPIFATFAVILGATSTILIRRENTRIFKQSLMAVSLAPTEVSALLPPPITSPVSVKVSIDLHRRLHSQDIGQKLRFIARDIASDLGFSTPGIAYGVDQSLTGSRYVIEVDMVPEYAREIDWDLVYIPASFADEIRGLGAEPVQLEASKSAPPLIGLAKTAMPAAMGEKTTFLDALTVIESDVQKVLRKNAAHFLGLQETRKLLAQLETEFKDLLREAQRVAPIQRIAEILRRLLDENIPIRNMRLILETILEWAPREQDNNALTAHVRLALRKQICFRVASEDNVILAIIMERQVEDALRKAIQDAAAKNKQTIDTAFVAALRQAVKERTSALPAGELDKAAFLVSDELRSIFRMTLVKAGFTNPVLSYGEIAQDCLVRTLSTIGGSATQKPANDTANPESTDPAQAIKVA